MQLYAFLPNPLPLSAKVVSEWPLVDNDQIVCLITYFTKKINHRKDHLYSIPDLTLINFDELKIFFMSMFCHKPSTIPSSLSLICPAISESKTSQFLSTTQSSLRLPWITHFFHAASPPMQPDQLTVSHRHTFSALFLSLHSLLLSFLPQPAWQGNKGQRFDLDYLDLI